MLLQSFSGMTPTVTQKTACGSHVDNWLKWSGNDMQAICGLSDHSAEPPLLMSVPLRAVMDNLRSRFSD